MYFQILETRTYELARGLLLSMQWAFLAKLWAILAETAGVELVCFVECLRFHGLHDTYSTIVLLIFAKGQ